MGLGSGLLKIIIIPVVLVGVVALGGFLLLHCMRLKRHKKGEIEASFQPPPVSQWTMGLQQQYQQQQYLQNQTLHQQPYYAQTPTTESYVQSPAPVVSKLPHYVEVVHTPA